MDKLTDEQIPHLNATGEKTYDADTGIWVSRTCRADELDFARRVIASHEASRPLPLEWPKITFEEVTPGLEVGYDILGGVDIRLGGEFVYVHINYDYRYTNNAARQSLADKIVELLMTGKVEAKKNVTP